MKCYLDSSVVLRAVLEQEGQFQNWSKISAAISSALLLVECHRVIDRCRLQGLLTDEEVADAKQNLQVFSRGITLLGVDNRVLQRASQPFSTVVGTLDAVHLSTAMLWSEQYNEELVFLSHDEQLLSAVRAHGIRAHT